LAAIHAGADDYTIKTAFSRDEFRQKLDRLFRQTRIPVAVVESTESEMDRPMRDDIEVETVEMVGVDADVCKWSGSNNLLQEAIDAWE